MVISIKDMNVNETTMSCFIYPGMKEKGKSYLEIDRETVEIVKLDQNEDCYGMHISMAISLLLKHENDNPIKDEYISICG